MPTTPARGEHHVHFSPESQIPSEAVAALAAPHQALRHRRGYQSPDPDDLFTGPGRNAMGEGMFSQTRVRFSFYFTYLLLLILILILYFYRTHRRMKTLISMCRLLYQRWHGGIQDFKMPHYHPHLKGISHVQNLERKRRLRVVLQI